MNRLVVAVLLIALLGVPVVTGCGDSPPQAPAQAPSTATAPAPGQEEGTTEATQEDEFVPPSDWCGTGRMTEYDVSGEMRRRSSRLASIPQLIKRLEDKDNTIVRAATVELGRLCAKEAVPALVRLLDAHDDPLVRLDATSALEWMSSADVFPPLIQALGDKNGLVRLAAWRILLGQARYLFPELDDDNSSESRRNLRRSLLDAVQEDIQRKWRTWWSANEKAVWRKMANPK